MTWFGRLNPDLSRAAQPGRRVDEDVVVARQRRAELPSQQIRKERQPVHSLVQLFLEPVVNEVNIGTNVDDVFVYARLGNDEQAVGRFRSIDPVVDQPLTEVSLRVEVHAQHSFVVIETETDGQVLRDGGFTGAALLVDKGEDLGGFFPKWGERSFLLE